MAKKAEKSLAAHSPAPWDVTLRDYAHMNTYVVYDQKEMRITNDLATAEANAKLIAAAPELLAALEAVAVMKHAIDCSWLADRKHKCRCHVALAEAAIRKARGE